MRSAGQVRTDLPRHVSSWTPAACEQSRGFHEQESKEKMEAAVYEEKMQELNRRVQVDLPLSAAERSAWRQWIVAYAASSSSSAGKRRKRKKRSKRKLPKFPSGVRIRRCGQGFRSRSSFSGAQCSLLLTTGPRCSTSWPVWTRRICSACARLGLLGFDDVPCAVLLLVVSGPRCPSSWPAWTTGQCGGSQVQFLDKVFYMPVGGVMVQTVQKTVLRFHRCSSSSRSSSSLS